ncbi:MAG: ribose-5-phosphate isomerase RpiA [Bosea sp. (in: a-proteobacteria)]
MSLLAATDADALKRLAAARALECVSDGMRLGLGTGSTAKHFVDLLGARVAGGLSVICVPTSEFTRRQAEGLGIPLTTLDETPELDLTIDGADEIDDAMRLIKGGGAALLREKIVAAASKRMIVITDASKCVSKLGKFKLPVEIEPFGFESTRRAVVEKSASAGCAGDVALRPDGQGRNLVTDGGHWLLDCSFGMIPDPEALSLALSSIPGVIEHGLFIGLATGAVIAAPEGLTLRGKV